MKTNKRIIKLATVVIGISMTASSCQDWLTVYPQTQVVEENFWEDKNDLEGVRYGAYKQMCSTVDKFAYWGELRSDNFHPWNRQTMTKQGFKDNAQSYQQMRSGMLEKDSANQYFDWGGIYTTINYCNKVLQHGEEVLNRDPQFTSSEWRQIKAEMIGLRALNYFYLIRAFKDVPYTTKVINNDSETRAFEATNQLVVLDSLIADMESVKGQARNRYTSNSDTKGCITNAALYAILSDMYLWRASLHEGRGLMEDDVQVWQQGGTLVHHTVVDDYRLAAEYADRSMEKLAEQLDRKGGSGSSSGMMFRTGMVSYGLPYVNLIKNNFTNFSDGVLYIPVAHDNIFYDGNSDESIFELQFSKSDNRGNGVVTDMFGSAADHYFSASQDALLQAFGKNENLFYRDARMWYCAQGKLHGELTDLPLPCVFKWQSMMPTFSPSAGKNPTGKDVILTDLDDDNNGYRNWIVYRLSDVMLQKAEALVCMDRLEADNNKLDEAMKLVHALHRRWYCNDNSTNALNVQPEESVANVDRRSWGPTDDASPNGSTFGNLPQPTEVLAGVSVYEVAVMNERQLEFIGEGKRWFDLVRFAERHAGGQNGTKDPREYTEELPIGNGQKGVELMMDQFMKAEYLNEIEILKTRFGNRYGLYNLIYYMEIKASDGRLEQNPAWNKSIYDL